MIYRELVRESEVVRFGDEDVFDQCEFFNCVFEPTGPLGGARVALRNCDITVILADADNNDDLVGEMHRSLFGETRARVRYTKCSFTVLGRTSAPEIKDGVLNTDSITGRTLLTTEDEA